MATGETTAAPRLAPDGPGITARWTSSAKSAVGTAHTALSRIWFTISHGILNEVYYPRVDMACIRDMGLIVTARHAVFEEKRDAHSTVDFIEAGVPAYRVINTATDGTWRTEKLFVTDPLRDALLQHTKFVPLNGGSIGDYRLFVILAPHLTNKGAGNTGWIDQFKGMPMLFARGSEAALALASTAPWLARSVGYVGSSDGWRQLMETGGLGDCYDRAEDGNIALIGEIDLAACCGEFTLALSFGRLSSEAAWRARSTLQNGYQPALDLVTAAWQDWQSQLRDFDRPANEQCSNIYRISTSVLKCHAAQTFAGGYIASLSIPWGFSKGDEDLGGYHLVWPRDLVETAGGFLACGAKEEARNVLLYLQATQEPTGGWPQNMWLDGTPYWTGQQMDETAFPILLYDMLLREDALLPGDADRFWPMIYRSCQFILCNGPVTGQDRWEEDGGFSPFTLAVEIAALLAAADAARARGEEGAACHLEETADSWNADIERWTYVTDGVLGQRTPGKITGYYVRIASPDTADAASPAGGFVPIKNRPDDHGRAGAAEIASPDALALVRFGLRSANDPRILDTVKVIDALLKSDLPQGPVWHRYNEDGYGEHDDGAPFDGTGVGRAWPLLTGERAHYELAAGDRKAAEALLTTLEASAGKGGLLPEQVWDMDDLPERELFRGRPSGSAMPLVWAHSEHIKLLRSLADGAVFDLPPQPVQRYQKDRVAPRHAIWSHALKRSGIPRSRLLRIELEAPGTVHWSDDGWSAVNDSDTTPSPFDTHYVDLSTEHLEPGGMVVFTIRWAEGGRWEGQDYQVTVE